MRPFADGDEKSNSSIDLGAGGNGLQVERGRLVEHSDNEKQEDAAADMVIADGSLMG